MAILSAARAGAGALLAAFAIGAVAQQPPAPQGPLPYGAPISLDVAKKAAAAAAAEAKKNGWFMAIAVAEPSGDLVYFEKMDNTQFGSINVALGKARTAAKFKRPSKVFQDLLAKGDNFTYLLGLEGAMPVQGGLPIVVDGKIVGAIGVSGATGDQDSQCAQAGLDALKK
jgi:glc operon protein GlcG